MKATILTLLDKFLLERRESSGGWAPVTQEDLLQLHRILKTIIEAKWGADPDGDRPINFLLVDRTRYEHISYLPVPYDRDGASEEEELEVLDTLLANLDMASRGVRRLIKLRRIEVTK